MEWGAAPALGQGADAFLGMQGDPWDTQWDMFMCLAGAIVAQVLLARVHDRQRARVLGEGIAPERRAAGSETVSR